MLRKTVIFLSVITLCYCQNTGVMGNKKRPYHYYDHDPHYHHMLYGGGFLYYLTFILIKIKVVFVLGTIFTIFLVAGKVFAIIKYAEIMKKSEKHHEPEKIYIAAPSHHDHLDHHDHGPPIDSFASYSGMTVDKLPPNAVIAGGGGGGGSQYYDSPPPHISGGQFSGGHGSGGQFSGGQLYDSPPPNAGGGQYYNSPPPHGYGRKYDNTVYIYYDLFMAMLKKLNLTDVVFQTMKIKSLECRKKFVCKADYNAKYNSILATTLSLTRDMQYDKYRTNSTIKSLADCDKLYQSCKNRNV